MDTNLEKLEAELKCRDGEIASLCNTKSDLEVKLKESAISVKKIEDMDLELNKLRYQLMEAQMRERNSNRKFGDLEHQINILSAKIKSTQQRENKLKGEIDRLSERLMQAVGDLCDENPNWTHYLKDLSQHIQKLSELGSRSEEPREWSSRNDKSMALENSSGDEYTFIRSCQPADKEREEKLFADQQGGLSMNDRSSNRNTPQYQQLGNCYSAGKLWQHPKK
eukprot:Filipodium_phascolosomae@DN6207_c0_g1_i1.p1